MQSNDNPTTRNSAGVPPAPPEALQKAGGAKAQDAATEKKYLTCAETAALVRKALKEAFPGVKFGVRSSIYSGGASISVSWTDGPNVAQVERITRVFKGAYFDGSIDYQGAIYHTLDGQPVTMGADYITTSREFSDAVVAPIVARVSKRFGVALDLEKFKKGGYFNVYAGNGGDSFQCLINAALYKHSDRLKIEASTTAGRVVVTGDDGYSRQCGRGFSAVSGK